MPPRHRSRTGRSRGRSPIPAAGRAIPSCRHVQSRPSWITRRPVAAATRRWPPTTAGGDPSSSRCRLQRPSSRVGCIESSRRVARNGRRVPGSARLCGARPATSRRAGATGSESLRDPKHGHCVVGSHGKLKTHCLTGWSGKTLSAMWAAVALMRLVEHDGHMDLPLQLMPTRNSCRQRGQRTREKPRRDKTICATTHIIFYASRGSMRRAWSVRRVFPQSSGRPGAHSGA